MKSFWLITILSWLYLMNKQIDMLAIIEAKNPMIPYVAANFLSAFVIGCIVKLFVGILNFVDED